MGTFKFLFVFVFFNLFNKPVTFRFVNSVALNF